LNKKKLFIYLFIFLAVDSSMILNINRINPYENVFNNDRNSIENRKKLQVKLLSNFTIDSSWVVIDTTTTAKTALDDVINQYITHGNTKFYIKDGVYNLNNSIKVNLQNVIIHGESKEKTQIIQPNVGNNNIEVTADNVQVSNLTIDNKQGEIAFVSKDSDKVTLEDCIIYGSPNNSAVAFWGKTVVNDIDAVENNNLCSNNIIQRNTIYSHLSGNLKDGLVFMKQKNGTIINNTILGNRIAFYLCRNSEVSSNTIENSDTNGIRFTVPAYDNKISNNTIDNTLASGICVVRSDSGITPSSYRASNITISNNTITNSRYFGIEISNLKDSTITNNTINQIDFDGIYLLYSDTLTVKQNKIYDIGLATATNGRKLWAWDENLNSGIFIDYSVCNSFLDYNEITNNYNNCLYGIKIQSGGLNLNNLITYNTITGDFSTGIDANTGHPEYTIIQNNLVNLNLIPAPTNLTTVSSLDNITLSWDPVVGATDYEIDIDGNVISNITSTSYVSTGLASNNSYKYRVRATGGNWSNFVTATTLPAVPPSNPVIIPAPNNTTTGSSVVIIPAPSNTTTGSSVVIIPAPSNTTTGSSVVIIHTPTKKTNASSVVTIPAPSNITTIAFVDKIKISWDPLLGSTGYEIEVNGNVINSGTKTSYINTGLISNNSYSYRVRTIGGNWSNFVTATTLPALPPHTVIIPAPTNITKASSVEIIPAPTLEDTPQLQEVTISSLATLRPKSERLVNLEKTSPEPTQSILIPTNIKATSQFDSITINWDTVLGVTGYEIEADGKIVDNGNNTSYVNTGLTSNTNHSYRVRIKGMEWSEILSVNTLSKNNIDENKENNIIESKFSIFNFIKNMKTYKVVATIITFLLACSLVLKKFLKH